MALEIIKKPAGQPDAGLFNLPIDFDTKKFAAEWVEEGQVDFKRHRQVLAQTKFTADGWEIWRKTKNSEATKVKTSNSKTYVLMCRPRKVQDDVNALFGNVSKELITQEVGGQTVAGERPEQGMLPEDRLKHELGGEGGIADDSSFQLNPLSEEPATT